MTDQQYYEGVGRRKRSTARARLFPGGAGKMTVNDLPGREYFDRLGDTTPLFRLCGRPGRKSSLTLRLWCWAEG